MADTLTGGHIDIIMGSYEGLLVGFHLMTSRDNTTTTTTTTQQLVSKFHEKSHTGSIRAITSSPNGILATGGYDEFIKLNDMKNHTEIGTLTQHEGTITCLQFFNDKYLFSSADDGIICIWDTTRWECLHILSGHRGPVYSIAIHPTGNLFLSSGKDRTLRTWDVSSGQCAYIKRLSQIINIIKWTVAGSAYVLVCDKSLTLNDVKSGGCIVTVSVGSSINCVEFIEDDMLAIGSALNDILIYSLIKGDLLYRLPGHTHRIKSLAVEGQMLFSGSSDGTIRVWNISDIDNCTCVCEVTGNNRLTCMSIVRYHPPMEGKKRKRIKQDEIAPGEEVGCLKKKKKKNRRSKSVSHRSHVSVEYDDA